MNNGEQFFNTSGGGYAIERSLRFNSADSAFLSRTPASAGNRKTWTWAGWVKRSALGSEQSIFTAWADDSNRTIVRFSSGDALQFLYQDAGTFYGATTNSVYRDTSAWYHLVFVLDTASSTSTSRVKLYVNGVEVTALTAFGSGIYPPQNTDYEINSTVEHLIAARRETGSLTSTYFSGYLADVHFIDGQALDPTSFGEFDDNGIWQPIAYSGTYGTNGFHLPFSDNSTAAALGTDTSGNGNDWTVNNISVAPGVTWSTGLSSTNGFLQPAAQAFNGTATNYLNGARTYNGPVTMTWAPPVPITINSTLVIDTDAASDNYVSFTGITTQQLTSRNYSVAGAAGNTISASNPLVLTNSQSTQSIALVSITIDGIRYVDNPAGPDSLVDVPTNGTQTDTGVGGEVRGNYCTLNPLNYGGAINAPTNGNLDVSSGTLYGTAYCTIGVSSGKWYWEFTTTSTNQAGAVGIAAAGAPLSSDAGFYSKGYIYFSGALKANNNSYTSYGATWTTNGDVIGVAYDADNGTLTFYKNGVSQGQAYSGIASTTEPYFPVYADASGSNSGSGSFNFGQRPFAYTAPSGFKALNTANLGDPVVTKPSEYMDVLLWSGTGGNRSFTGLEMSPDFVWIKQRNQAYSVGHQLYDIVRGAGSLKQLDSSNTTAEGGGNTNQYGYLSSFDSAGFSVAAGSIDSDYVNKSGVTYVAWNWDAGSSTVTNEDGSITSSVRANPSAGFSVVTFTTQASGTATVGHGLGVAPEFFIIKARTVANNWWCYHKSLPTPQSNAIALNTTGAALGSTTLWNNTAPTSSVISFSSDWVGSNPVVVYAFAPVSGYSSIGSWIGNGSADGPFVFTGFRVRFLLFKTTSTGYWGIYDAARNTYNAVNSGLYPNDSLAEITDQPIDFLSNGFKIRGTNAFVNASSQSYIYYAVAESPFQYARAR